MGSGRDETFIPIGADEDVVTPERMAKGDLSTTRNAKGKINGAAPHDKYVIDKLLKNGVLEHHHKMHGLGFLELRAAFCAPWAAKSSAILLAQWGAGVSLSRATEIYQNVTKRLLGKGTRVIQYALEVEVAEEIGEGYSRAIYQEYFDNLVTYMDEELERIRKERESGL